MSILTFLDSIFRQKRFNSAARKGGALRDWEDSRDFLAGNSGFQLYPENADLRPYIKEIKSQGKFNSCVAHSICSSIELQINMKKNKSFIPLSERFVYFYGRKEGNCFPADGGMFTREAIKAVFRNGVAPEFTCGYYSAGINEEPSKTAQIVGNLYTGYLKEYRRLNTIDDIKSYVGNQNIPVNLTVPYYASWSKVGSDGIISVPSKKDSIIGYHSVLVVGYTEDKLIILNSWNSTWGQMGCAYLPLDYPMEDKWAILLN